MSVSEIATPSKRRMSLDLKWWNEPQSPCWIYLALLWGQLFWALYPSWADGTYYDYGMTVPFLAVFFFWTRWQEIPGNNSLCIGRVEKSGRSFPLSITLLAAVIICTLLRLVESVDTGWRLPLYIHGGIVLGITTWLLSRLQSWPKVATFWPIAILTLLAIPLPSGIESSLIHQLTGGVVEAAVFTNRMAGLPVMSSGETLFVNGVPLQVSEGCSGIRSFQGSLFAGFVLGEFVRLSLIGRGFLVLLSLLVAFLMNCLRVVFLVQYAADNPQADLEPIHDQSGYVSLTLTFVIIMGLAYLLGRTGESSQGKPAVPPGTSEDDSKVG
jgi:exosortase